MRTVVIHRADKITGPWEGRVALRDKGIAQGGLVDTPEGRWFSYLFRDFGSAAMDISKMKEGDFAGLTLLQRKFGIVGVKYVNGSKSIIMINAQSGKPFEAESIPLNQKTVFLKAECDFRDKADIAHFLYSLDGKVWIPIGTQLKMEYSIPHFMGYRFGLFNYATKSPGGYVDFDWFRIK
jgi:beta-xylosidase